MPPTSTVTPTRTIPPTTISTTIYPIIPTANECGIPTYHSYGEYPKPAPGTYSLTNEPNNLLVWTSNGDSGSVYALLICKYKLSASVSTAKLSFDEGAFERDPVGEECKSSVMQLVVYSGDKAIKDGRNLPTKDALPFQGSPPPETRLSYVPSLTSDCPNQPDNSYQFSVPNDKMITVVALFVDGWANQTVTVTLSGLRLETLQ